MAKDDAVPPVPVPPTGAGLPPVEPPPAVPAPTPAAPAAPVAPPVAAPSASPYGAPPAAYAPVPAGPPQGLAITSFVCGIGGLLLVWFGLGFLASIAAVVTGHLAQKRQPYARGFWITGLITGYLGILIGLIFGLVLIVSLIAIFSAGYYG
ncbi:MAG: DUF4190 domain-containing protein [Rhodoglobus sp.]